MTRYLVIGVLFFIFLNIYALISIFSGGPHFFQGIFIIVISIVIGATALLYFVSKKFKM